MPRKIYDARYRKNVLKLIQRDEVSISQLATMLGIAPGTIYRWRHEGLLNEKTSQGVPQNQTGKPPSQACPEDPSEHASEKMTIKVGISIHSSRTRG